MLPNKAVTCHTEIRSIHARDHYMSITMQIFWPWWVLGPSVLIFLRGTSSIFSHPSGCRHLDPDRSLKTFARAADRYEYFKRAKDYRNASIVTACGLYIRSLGSWISASIYLDFFVGYMNDRQAFSWHPFRGQARRSDMSQAAWCQWTHLHASLRLEVRPVWDDFQFRESSQHNFTGGVA